MYYPLFFQKSIQATDLHVNNHLFSDTGYYLHYLKMRLKQYEVLQIIATNIQRMEYVPAQAKEVSQYLKRNYETPLKNTITRKKC